MKSVFYPVHPALQNFVSNIMVVDVHVEQKALKHHIPFPPMPQNNINFYPADAMFPRKVGNGFSKSADAIIVGPQTTRVDLAMGKHHVLVSVAFNPGGMFRLLKIPMYELMDEPFDAADLLGKGIREVNERLKNAKGALEMKTIVENYLLSKLNPQPLTPLERAMKAMLQHNKQLSMDNIAASSCMSFRNFERRSKEILGYSPKFFSKLIRFSEAYRMKINNPAASWGSIANHCGYYDQMHLIKDFKQFTAVNPRLLGKEIMNSPLQVQKDILF